MLRSPRNALLSTALQIPPHHHTQDWTFGGHPLAQLPNNLLKLEQVSAGRLQCLTKVSQRLKRFAHDRSL
jgi:hypothetical protein